MNVAVSKRSIYILLLVAVLTAMGSCMKYEPMGRESFDLSGADGGVFIVNEGNFMYGNATLSLYLPDQRRIENEVFIRANAVKLGDVAQSIAIHNDRAYITVNQSGVVFVVDLHTLMITGLIEGLSSPRYIHFLSDTKAYITDLYGSRITIFNPQSLEITGYIETPNHRSTEQMVEWRGYLFVSCWSGGQEILVIDTRSDSVVEEIEVGWQPRAMVIDVHGKIWCATSGRSGADSPALWRIDAQTRVVERRFDLQHGDFASDICLNGDGSVLYFINRSVWRMDVTAEHLPTEPFMDHRSTIFYSLWVHPESSDIYVGDAIDYEQAGVVYRMGAQGQPIDTIRVGIIPTAFAVMPAGS